MTGCERAVSVNTKRRKILDRLLMLGGVLCILAAVFLWIKPDKAVKYNVLLITLDTTRADRLGSYGYTPSITPNLDALADRGVVFERAYCNVPLTLPSHASIMTGLMPPEHGLRLNSRGALDEDIPVMASVFTNAGYSTAAFVASPVLDAKYGLARGFHIYDDRIDIRTAIGNRGETMYRRGDKVANRAISWLKQQGGKENFFCWVHLYDPHYPYYAHEDVFGEKFTEKPYDAEIAFVDMQVGRILAALDPSASQDRTLVIAVADHGESLPDDAHYEPRPHHGYMLYEPTVNVPMIMYLPPSLPAGNRTDTLVSLTDLFSAVPLLAGLRPPDSAGGRNLIDAIKNREGHEAVYAETLLPGSFGWASPRMLVKDEWKYIGSPEQELYNLATDPVEDDNIASEKSRLTAAFRNDLANRTESMETRAADKVALTGRDIRQIQSLGYAGGGVNPAMDTGTAEADKRDIKHALPLLRDSAIAQEKIKDREFEEAISILAKLREESPETTTFHVLYASALTEAGRERQAEKELRDLLKETREPRGQRMRHMLLNNLAYCLSRMGRYREGMPYIKEALQLNPQQAEYHHTLATIFAGLGNKEKALLAARMSFRLDDTNPEHMLYCAEMEMENGNRDKAKKILEIVLEARFHEHFKEKARELLRELA
jgi:arylsulfatase A-like enzyme/Flp pilus assembly protein TadD